MVFHQAGLSSGWSLSSWSLITVVFHQAGLLSLCSFIKLVSYHCGLSSSWSRITVVFHQAGLLSLWSFIKLVSHHCGLSSSWSLITVVLHQGSAVHAIIMETGGFDSHAVTPGFQAPLSQRRKKWSTAWSIPCRPGTPFMDR